LLETELSEALLQIKAHPLSAPKARGLSLALQAVRRVSLVQTRYHLYFRVDEKRQQIRVHHVWHMSRRAPKSL
jgi:plasmid stabilization system protein ParE